MQEQMGLEIIEEDIPPSWEDMPEVVIDAVNTFNQLGDRAYPDIGYMGKDYTNLNHYMELYTISDKEFFLQLLNWLDSRAIEKSQDRLKREHEKLKRKNSGPKRS
tara:strand:- start:1960 stop:2274 length:315 start_codon:yes stop_codon:yes gene_type:complete